MFRFVFFFLILEYLGSLFMGLSFDYSGSYDLAYIFFIFLALAAAGLILSLRRPRREKV